MSRTGRYLRVLRVAAIGVALPLQATVAVSAQEEFQFVISATNAAGRHVTEFRRDDVTFTENGVPNEVIRVQPLRIPVELTVAIDNSSANALAHIRAGLDQLVRKLDADIEVEIITIAPQPRRVVRATTNRLEILRGITLFGPESSPKFTDALVEFAKRYQEEFDETSTFDSIPVLVLLSTTAPDQWSYDVQEVSKALSFLRVRRARVYVTMLSERSGLDPFDQINDNRQALIGIPAAESTGGKYVPLAISNRLVSLLPEWGEEINALHRRYSNQAMVTVRRREGLTGPLQTPEIGLAGEGLTGEVSLSPVPPLTELK
jgi:hypothetical protein